MRSIWRKLVGPCREFGALFGVLYLLNRLLRALSPRLSIFVYEFMVQPVTSSALLPPRLSRHFTYAEIGPGHADLARMPAHDDVKYGRFAQQARCLGVYSKDVLIGYIWFCFDQYDEDEVRCTYILSAPEKSVFDFDLFVFPEHRMGVGFLAVWHGANMFLRQRGIEYTFSRVTRFNTASRRAHAHLGWKKIGDAVFLQAWHLEVMVANIAPYVAASWSRNARVGMHLTPGSASS